MTERIHLKAVLAVALAMGLTIGSLSADETLIRNPGFENPDADGRAPAAWTLPSPDHGTRFTWDTETVRNGRRAARIEGADQGEQPPNVQACRQDIPLASASPLDLSVWVKARDVTQGRVAVLHQGKNGKVLLNQTLSVFDGTFDWCEFGGTITPVDGAVSLQIMAGLRNSTGVVWLDDVTLVPAGPAVAPGRASIIPSAPQPVNKVAEVRFEVTLGGHGLAVGDAVTLRWEAWSPARSFTFKAAEASADRSGARLDAEIVPSGNVWPKPAKPIACVATLAEGPALQAGDKVTVTARVLYARQSNVVGLMRALVPTRPGGNATPLANALTFQSRGGPAAAISCLAEARPIEGQTGRVTVSFTDEHGNPAADFRGTVRLRCNTQSDLPARYTFTEADAGSHDFSARFPAGEVSRVVAVAGDMRSNCNPIFPRKSDEPGVFFGDIHSHCEISGDGVGDPDLGYDYARRFHGLDFAALSDHSPVGEKWRRIVEVGNRHNAPGRFATLIAFEWSDFKIGHRNAYYRADDGPEKPSLKSNMKPWWDFLDEQDVRVLTVPHHSNTMATKKRPDGTPVWGPVDWSEINHKYQRLVELNQNRGSFEAPGGPIPELRIERPDVGASAQTALEKGHRIGFIGSTDTHSGRPGSGPARCAVFSPRLARTDLWDGLHDRLCYSTSGKHILMFFSLNDRPMGTEIALTDSKTPRHATWRVIGTGPIARIDLLRNNEVVESFESLDADGNDDVTGSFAFNRPLGETEWWYLRVIQKDTEMAWSSPIWVDPAADTSRPDSVPSTPAR